MKKRLSALVALVLTMVMSISVACADDYHNEGTIGLPGRSISCKNVITQNTKESYAWTSGGTSTYVSVEATYYIYNTFFQTKSTAHDAKSSSIYARIDADSLVGTSEVYYKTVSNHYGSYGENNGTINGLTTRTGLFPD